MLRICFERQLLFVILSAAEGVVEEDRKGDLLNYHQEVRYAVLEVFARDLWRALNKILGGDDVEYDVLEEV